VGSMAGLPMEGASIALPHWPGVFIPNRPEVP